VAARSGAAVHPQYLGRLAAQDQPRHGRSRLPRHLESDPAVVAWWQQNGWQGGPGLFAYTIDAVSGDLFIAFNGSSRTTFARLDPDTLQLKSWYRIGLFTPGPMLVFAGRYVACKSALAGDLAIIDFDNPIGGPTLAASVDYSSHSTGLAIDPERARLYVLTESATGAEGWVSWVDAAFEKHGPWHLVDDLGLPAGSTPSGIAYDRTSGRVIIGASTGLFACHPETLEIEQSLLGNYSGGGFVDAWENQPTVDGELWLPFASTIHRIDAVTLTPIASCRRDIFKHNRSVALAEWRQLAA
jgi:hypothetical protein